MKAKKLPGRSAQAHREQIASLPLVDELTRIMSILAIGFVPTYARPTRATAMHAIVATKPRIVGWEPLKRDDVARYTLLLKATEALLRKILPDLRSVEITDSAETKRTLTDQELAQRISAVLTKVKGKARPSTPDSQLPTLNPKWLN